MKTETKNKIDIGKASSKLILLCWLTIIFCLILKFFGYKEFEIPLIKYDLNIWLIRFINCAIYVLNGLCLSLILLKRKLTIKELIFISLSNIFIFAFMIFNIFVPYKFVFEIILYLCIGFICIRDKWYKILLEILVITIILSLYQVITMTYKNINVNIIVNGFIENLILQIDYYLMILLTIINCFKRGGYLYERGATILVFLSKRKCVKESLQQDQNDVQEEIGYKLFIIVLSITQIFIVGTVCYFVNNVILEYFIIIISFFIMRQVFGKSYHADSVLACTTLSVIVFTIATRLPLPQWTSILCNVFIGCMVAYVMYMWYYYAKYGTKEDIVIHNGMKREDLIYLCEKANLTKIATDRMIMKYVEGKTVKEIAEIESLEIDSIKSSLHRSRKAIQS